MSIYADLKKLRTGAGDLRKFGLTVGGVFILLGILFLLRHRSSYSAFFSAGGLLMAFGIIWPRALKYVYVDGTGLHAGIRDVERDPDAVLFPGRHADRATGSSLPKRFPYPKMG